MAHQRGDGWLTKASRKKGDVWLHHFYTTRDFDGKRVETTRTIGLVSQFPREDDVWEEVKRTRRCETENILSGRLTMNQLIDSYKKMELPHLAHSTQVLNGPSIDNYVASRWGMCYVDEIHVLEVRKWFMAIAEEKSLTQSSIRKIKQTFGRLFSYGIENGLLAPSLNPVAICNIRGIGRKSRTIKLVVSPETAWKIAMELPIITRTLVLLAAATAMRTSEMLGLRWADIDFDKKTITLRRTWVYGADGEGKTGESRKPIVLGDRVCEFLLQWRRETPYAKATDWVFPSFKLKGKKPLTGSQWVQDHLRPLYVKYGVIEADYKGRAGLHAFRHSLSTVLIVEEKVDPKTAQGILRHATADVTMDIYTHAQDAQKRAALERFESRLMQ